MARKFKKLPYGKSNFADLIEQNFAYVDKTRFIELLENDSNSSQLLLRPRRFGKSLFLSVLENYYDINRKDKFETLFGNLYIGKNPTSQRNKYLVIRFDFSGLNIDSREGFNTSFFDVIKNAVLSFLEYYKNLIDNADLLITQVYETSSSSGILDILYRAANNAATPLFVIIDEYDHFANKLIAMGEKYVKEVKSGGIVRAFYEKLKFGTSSIVKRIFMTGVSPMMMNDVASSFNMVSNLSLLPAYNEMFGFTRKEVEQLASETGIDMSLINVDMEAYYNGYLFNDKGKNKVYNSQMVLFLFYKITQLGEQPKEIIDINLKSDSGRLQQLAENENNREKMLQIIKEGGIFSEVIENFSLDDLQNEKYFISLLFYLGMLTNGGVVEERTYLKIPNYSIKTLFWEYLAFYIQERSEKTLSYSAFSDTVTEMAFRGNIYPYLEYFSENILKLLSNRDLMNFDEKYIKATMLPTLYLSNLYLPVSEDENKNGYSDIYLQKRPTAKSIKYEYIFELKYLKANATKKEKNEKMNEAIAQIEKYKKDERYANRDDMKFIAIVFEGKGDYEAKEVK